MHKKLISTVALSLILLAPTISNANSNLSDINNHWAKKEIENFISNGYISGYPESNTFKPDNTITRAEFVKIVNRYFNFTEGSYSEFEDVVSDKWYYKEIAIAENIGYINGKTPMFFEPNSPITREEVAKIITTITNTLDYNYNKINSIPDGSNVSSWARPYVEGALEQGYIRGNDSGYINPKSNISRAEAIVMLSRVDNNNGGGVQPPVEPDYEGNNIPPVIELRQDTVELKVGEKYVIDAITSIFDFYDPDQHISMEPVDVQIDVSKVDTSKPGTYEATILVSDAYATTSATVKVIVKGDINNVPNNAPTLSVTNVAINIKEAFSNDMLKATATDVDGDAVTIAYEGTVNTNKVGTYSIKVIATDAKGAKTEKTATVKVNAVKPVVNGNNVTITEGDAFNNAMVGANATDCEGKAINVAIAGTVNSNVPGSYKLVLTATDAWGLVSTKEVTVTVEARVVAGITNPNSSEFKAMVANEMYALVNAHRVANGQSELVTLNRLEGMANAWSKHMSDTGVFDHVINGKNVMETFPEFGESDLENIASLNITGAIFTEADAKALANRLFTNWKNSAGHNNSMLDAWNKSIGFGFYAKETSPGVYRIYATQEFYGLTTRSEEAPIVEVQE